MVKPGAGKSWLLLCLWIFLLLGSSCRLTRLSRNLEPQHADFLSKVRYIITREEEKIFLELPGSEKDAFIEEFWKRRDPDPETEENEFKTEYNTRIDAANRLFVAEGKPGWLTDRGRIYIVFGPPLDRIRNPMGGDSSSRCYEVWYYGDFPVVFQDHSCTGDYKLVTYDLTSLRDLNLAYMHQFNLDQAEFQKTYLQENPLFDFNWRVKKKAVRREKIEGLILIDIPYAVLTFEEEENRLKAMVELDLELRDADGRLFWEHHDAFEIALGAEELKIQRNSDFRLEILFLFEKDLKRLSKGKSRLYGRLENVFGREELRKVMELTF